MCTVDSTAYLHGINALLIFLESAWARKIKTKVGDTALGTIVLKTETHPGKGRIDSEYLLGRDEIEGVYLPAQQERTPQLWT